jgi:hypothetical protein
MSANFAGETLIDVAPDPVLPVFDRADKGVLSCIEMPRGVLVPGGIAAADVAAGETKTEMNPGVAELHAFRADVRGGGRDFDLIEMSARGGHRNPPFWIRVL